MPTAARRHPAATTGRGPVLGSSTAPENTAPTMISPTIGRNATPVRTGENPSVSAR